MIRVRATASAGQALDANSVDFHWPEHKNDVSTNMTQSLIPAIRFSRLPHLAHRRVHQSHARSELSQLVTGCIALAAYGQFHDVLPPMPSDNHNQGQFLFRICSTRKLFQFMPLAMRAETWVFSTTVSIDRIRPRVCRKKYEEKIVRLW